MGTTASIHLEEGHFGVICKMRNNDSDWGECTDYVCSNGTDRPFNLCVYDSGERISIINEPECPAPEGKWGQARQHPECEDCENFDTCNLLHIMYFADEGDK
jgi:hypothetical protein